MAVARHLMEHRLENHFGKPASQSEVQLRLDFGTKRHIDILSREISKIKKQLRTDQDYNSGILRVKLQHYLGQNNYSLLREVLIDIHLDCIKHNYDYEYSSTQIMNLLGNEDLTNKILEIKQSMLEGKPIKCSKKTLQDIIKLGNSLLILTELTDLIESTVEFKARFGQTSQKHRDYFVESVLMPIGIYVVTIAGILKGKVQIKH